MPILKHVPIINTDAYTAGDCVGTIFELSTKEMFVKSRAVLMSIAVVDLAAQNAELVFRFFSQKPSAGTYTNNSALDLNDTDLAYFIGQVAVKASDYETAADNSTASVTSIGLVLEADSPASASASAQLLNLWCVVETNGTPTYVSASDLIYKFGLIED